MKTSLTKNQLAYILSATSNPKGTRPQLSYAYYLADTNVVVSTDAYRVHEIQDIDLGPVDLIIDSKGTHSVPLTYHKFPSYLPFFPSNPTYQFMVTLNVDNVKLIRDIAQYAVDNNTILTNGTLTPLKESLHKNLDTLDFSSRIYQATSAHKNPPPIGLNINYLYQHTRYIDKPHLTTISISDPLKPIIFESLIDNQPVRTLIMPLKI